MSAATFVLSVVLLVTLLGQSRINQSSNQNNGLVSLPERSQQVAQLRQTWNGQTLRFEADRSSQLGTTQQYIARGNGYGFFVQPTSAKFLLRSPQAATRMPAQAPTKPVAPVQLQMSLQGANANAELAALEPLTSQSHYFIGQDRKQWRAGVKHYASVKASAVYQGIDLVYYGNQQQLEYDFIVAPGANPAQIALRFAGAKRMEVAANGDLILHSAAGELRQQKPVIYQQEADGSRKFIEGEYLVKAPDVVGFALGDYDQSRSLTIDPVLVYSTFLGGLDVDFGNGIDVDNAGNAYVTGITYSGDFPLTHQLQSFQRGLGNAFISKFDRNGKLIYSTYLGGEAEDVGFAIAADAQGNAYVTGSTDSTNFPLGSGALQAQKRGRLDAFAVKLSTDGSQLLYSTYLGGEADDLGNSIAVDVLGNAYLTGQTLSSGFPLRNPYQNSLRGGADAFITKLNASGSQILSSTFLGGNAQETAFGITLDRQNDIYVTGITYSADFPRRNAAQNVLGGRVDAFITKLNNAGDALVYSTYVGGAQDDGGFGIGVDNAGNAYACGFTTSTNFPVLSAAQANNAGGDDAFMLKLTPAGALAYSTYWGGAGQDRAFDLDVSDNGETYVIGRTESINFPAINAVQPKLNSGQVSGAAPNAAELAKQRAEGELVTGEIAAQYGRDGAAWQSSETNATGLLNATAVELRDGFVVKLTVNGVVVYSTFLGGQEEEKVFSIAIDNAGAAYVTGLTASYDFPLNNAIQTRLRGFTDAFVSKIADQANTHSGVSAANYVPSLMAPDQIVALFGSGFGEETKLASTLPLPFALGGLSLRVTDRNGASRPAPIFFVSPTQINLQVPSGTAIGPAEVAVIRNGVVVSTENIEVNQVAPGVFSADASGRGAAAGVALRVKADGTQVYEPLVRYDNTQRKFVSVPLGVGAEGEQVYLVVFATGLRYRSNLANVTGTLGGATIPVLYAGSQGELAGLDQLNVQVPSTLAGRGELDLVLSIDGKVTNPVKITFK